MKSIYLLSDDLFLSQRWKDSINYDTIILEDEENLENIQDSILVFNMQVCKNMQTVFLKQILEKNNQILLLDNIPNLSTAQKYLKIGVKAYGNTLMSSSFLNSALDALNNNFVWLIPSVTTQLVSSMVETSKKSEEEINDTIFKNLTQQERKIANLLKNAKTNAQISAELNISINTVKTHIKKIYEKLCVKDRISFSLLFR